MLAKFGRRSSRKVLLRKSTNTGLQSLYSDGEQSVNSKVTLPKDLYKSNNITKENKGEWENTSRKIRAIIPIFTKMNNQETRRAKRKESRKSAFSIFSKSSKK